MKTVETTVSNKIHRLSVIVDLNEGEEEILEAIDVLVSRLGRIPILLTEEQKHEWENKMEKPNHFAFIKAHSQVRGCRLVSSKKIIEDNSIQGLGMTPARMSDFWEVYWEIKNRKLEGSSKDCWG